MSKCVLIVDDDDALRQGLELLLMEAGYRVVSVDRPESALDFVRDSRVDAIFCSVRMSGLDGFDLIRQISQRAAGVPIILTANGEPENLVKQAIQRGAFDYLVLPGRPDDIRLSLRRARQHVALHRRNELQERDISSTHGDQAIVAASDGMISLLELLERIAGFRSTVLITGERGTGKEVIARAVHAQSPRRDAPFITVRCGGTTEQQLESELFGHLGEVVGATPRIRHGLFGEANSGSLFLDEVAELSPGLQLKLLHVIQEEEFRPVGGTKATQIDVRIIASTSRDLELEMTAGRFREDLFYRLDVVRLDVPALRQRREDLPLLVDHFLSRFRRQLGRDVRGISDEALDFLLAYRWPGNVRELQNMIERAVILSDGERVELSVFPQIVQAAMSADDESYSLKRARRAFEAQLIRRALERMKGNRTHAAKLLEISHRALLYKLKDYGIRD